jgi:hypothetical protein
MVTLVLVALLSLGAMLVLSALGLGRPSAPSQGPGKGPQGTAPAAQQIYVPPVVPAEEPPPAREPPRPGPP